MLDNDIYAKVIQLLAYLFVRHGIHLERFHCTVVSIS